MADLFNISGEYKIIEHSNAEDDTSGERITIGAIGDRSFSIISIGGPTGDWTGSFTVDEDCISGRGDYRYKVRNHFGRHEFKIDPSNAQIVIQGTSIMPRLIGPYSLTLKREASKKPGKWGADEVTGFLDAARDNAVASFVNNNELFEKLIKIDRVYRKITSARMDQGFWFSRVLSQKAHPAFLAAVQLGLNTQITESYCQMRSVLEYALYAYFINKNPKLADIWANRQNGEEARKAVKNAFKISPIIKLLEEEHSVLGSVVNELYNRTIDWGAHPNANSLFGVLEIEEGADSSFFKVAYLSGNHDLNAMCLKNVAQVGIAWLKILQFIMPEQYSPEILMEVDTIAQGL